MGREGSGGPPFPAQEKAAGGSTTQPVTLFPLPVAPGKGGCAAWAVPAALGRAGGGAFPSLKVVKQQLGSVGGMLGTAFCCGNSATFLI